MPPWLLPSSSSLPPTTSSNSFPSLTSTSSSSASSSNSRATTPQPRASQRSRARKTIFSGGSGGAPDVVSREGHRLPTRDRLNSTSPSSPSNSQTTTPSLSSTRETNRTSKGKKTTGALYRSTSCCICTSSIEFERLERAQCVRCERCGVWNDYLPPLSTILRTREVDDSVDARCRICHGEGAGDSEEQERDCKCLEHDKDGRYDEAGLSLSSLAPTSSSSSTLRLDDDFSSTLSSLSLLPPSSTPFLDLLRTALLSLSHLSSSPLFFAPRTSNSGSTGSGTVPSLKLLEEFRQRLSLEEPGGEEARDILKEGMERILGRPGIGGALLTAEEGSGKDRQDGWVIVLLESPVFLPDFTKDTGERMFLVGRLMGLIANLPNSSHHTLVTHLSHTNYPAELLREKVEMITSFVSYRIGICREFEVAWEEDWSIKSAGKVGNLLFHANSMNPRIPITSFYSTALDSVDPEILLDEFEKWETSPLECFSLCQYPHLLSLGIKIHLLAYDGSRQMEEVARHALRSSMYQPGGNFSPFLLLRVRRNYLIDDSLQQIAMYKTELKKGLKISFEGEDGIDVGGLRKEWFLLLCRQLFDPQYGMFIVNEESSLSYFNPATLESGDEFYLVGSIIGLAIYNNVTLDIPFPLVESFFSFVTSLSASDLVSMHLQAIYKKLLKESLGLRDLAVLDPGLAKGLQALLDFEKSDEELEEVFGRTFVGTYEFWGDVIEVELFEGGKDISVTIDNRQEFVRLYVDFLLNTSVATQYESFERGFNEVTSGNGLSLFQGEELELLVRGSLEELDVELFKRVTVYEGFDLGEGDLTVQFFWRFFASLSSKEQRSLLSFITGSDRIPATGTGAMTLRLTNMGQDTGRWPTSHTCFNQLCLYEYTDYESFRSKLMGAMLESEGFGLR